MVRTVTPRVTPRITRRTTAYTRRVIAEMAAQRAAEGLPLDRVLTEAARIVLEHRRRAGGHLGSSDEDSSWAADLAIEVYEGIRPPRGIVACLVCGKLFRQDRFTAKFCCATHRHTWYVRNWRAKKKAATAS